MHGRSRFRTRARGSGAALSPFLFQASTYGATDAWDFVNDQYIRGGLLSDGGISITRNSVGTAETADGRIVTFGAGELRRTDKGILVEGARTNLFLNSLVGATQTITVTAVAHTLSFYGTGTITLSGTSTAGPLVGTGAGQRVTLTFTPTAGSLTLTVSGTVEYVQLEVGAFASSWIPTEGTSVQRAADQVTAVPTAGTDYPMTLFAEFQFSAVSGSAGTRGIVAFNDAGGDLAYMYTGQNANVRTVVENASATQAFITVTKAQQANVAYKSAVRVETNNFQLAYDGVLGTIDTNGNEPNTPTVLYLGNANNNEHLHGYLRRVAVIKQPLINTKLQEITT